MILKIVISFLTIVMSIFVFDFMSNMFLHTKSLREAYTVTRDIFNFHDEHVLFDSELGFVLAPNISYRIRNSEYDIQISTNSAGFRDDEESLIAPDILMVGDSFVFGSGVTDGATAADYLEAFTGLSVLNTGVAQYGPLQEAISLQRILKRDDCGDCKVFWFFYSGNDLNNNVNRLQTLDVYHPWIDISEADLPVVPPTYAGYENWRDEIAGLKYPSVSHHSYAAYLIVAASKKLSTPVQMKRKKVAEADKARAFDAVMDRFGDACSAVLKQRISFVFVPSRLYYEDPKYSSKVDVEFEQIVDSVTKNGISVLDLRSFLSEEDYYELDGHWRPETHAKIAAYLAGYLDRDGQELRPEFSVYEDSSALDLPSLGRL